MLFKGVITQASGSIGGITASHNKGGLYFRARTIPTNPASPQQVAVRNNLSQLVTAWNALTTAQRNSWIVYGDNVTKTNPLGDQIKVSGINWYMGANSARLQAAFARVDEITGAFDRGSHSGFTFTADATADEVDVGFTNTDDWANEDDSAALVYASRPQNPGIAFFKGPYRFAGSIDGDGVTPPTSPATIALPFAVAAGQQVFFQVVVIRADGRYSSPFRGSAIAA